MATQMTVDQLKGFVGEEIDKVVGSKLDERLKTFQEKQSSDIRAMFTQSPAEKQEKAEKGITAAKALMAIAGAALSAKQGRFITPADWATKHLNDGFVAKALSAGVGTEGGYTVPDVLSTEVIELLRPASVVMSLNPTVIPMDNGNITIPKLTGGASATYIGENANVGKTQQVFGQVTANAKKLGALVPISNDLLRRTQASGGAAAMIRDDMVAALSQKTDYAFLLEDGTGNKPTGFLNQVTPITGSGLDTLDAITADLGKMVLNLAASNVRFIRPGWIMAPRSWNRLMTVRDGNGNYAFRDEMLRGTLWGWPFRWTTQIPVNVVDDETYIFFADFADVVVAQSTSLMVDVSTEAAYHDGSNVVAAFSLDQTVIRAIIEHDLILRHAESVCVMSGVEWGA